MDPAGRLGAKRLARTSPTTIHPYTANTRVILRRFLKKSPRRVWGEDPVLAGLTPPSVRPRPASWLWPRESNRGRFAGASCRSRTCRCAAAPCCTHGPTRPDRPATPARFGISSCGKRLGRTPAGWTCGTARRCRCSTDCVPASCCGRYSPRPGRVGALGYRNTRCPGQ